MAWRVLLVPRCGQQVKQASTWLLDCVSAEDFTLKGRTTLTLTSLAPSPSQGQVRGEGGTHGVPDDRPQR